MILTGNMVLRTGGLSVTAVISLIKLHLHHRHECLFGFFIF